MDGVRRWPIREPSECALLWVFSDSSSVVVVPFGGKKRTIYLNHENFVKMISRKKSPLLKHILLAYKLPLWFWQVIVVVVTSEGLDGWTTWCRTKGTGGGDGSDDSSSSLRILTKKKKETSLKIDYLFFCQSNYSIKVNWLRHCCDYFIVLVDL